MTTFMEAIRRSKRAALVTLLQLDEPWHDDSIRAEDLLPYPATTCNRCGKCCRSPYRATIHPGEIWNWIHEERLMLLEHVVAVHNEGKHKFALQFKNEAGMANDPSCVFLSDDGGGCTVYTARPLSCRVYVEAQLVGGILPACDPSCYAGTGAEKLPVSVPLLSQRSRAADDRLQNTWGMDKWNAWVMTVVKAINAWVASLKAGATTSEDEGLNTCPRCGRDLIWPLGDTAFCEHCAGVFTKDEIAKKK